MTKKKRKFSMDFDKLKKKFDEEKEKYKDERFWKLTINKEKKGSAIIRFIPDKNGECFVKIREHSFSFFAPDGEKKWVIGLCKYTLDKECEICKHVSTLYNSGLESDIALGRDRKATKRYISNILVVKDPANPENEGKVFLFKYGQKIFEKIQTAIQGDDEIGEDPLPVFDPYEGVNFKLISREKDGYVNYDNSKFDTKVTKIAKTDEEVDEIIETQTFELAPIIKDEKLQIDAKNYQLFVETLKGNKGNKVVEDETITTEDVDDIEDELNNVDDSDEILDEDELLNEVDDILDED